MNIGWATYLFDTQRSQIVVLEPGTYPILVTQTRIGPNAGAVTVTEGRVSLITYQTSIWGVGSGKFLRESLSTTTNDLHRQCSGSPAGTPPESLDT